MIPITCIMYANHTNHLHYVCQRYQSFALCIPIMPITCTMHANHLHHARQSLAPCTPPPYPQSRYCHSTHPLSALVGALSTRNTAAATVSISARNIYIYIHIYIRADCLKDLI